MSLPPPTPYLSVRPVGPDGQGCVEHQGRLRDWQIQVGGSAAATTFFQKKPNLVESQEFHGGPQGRPGMRVPLLLESLHPILAHRSPSHCTYHTNPISPGCLVSLPSQSQCRGTSLQRPVPCVGMGLWPKSWAGERPLRPEQESEPCILMPQMYSLPERPKGLGP